jgi:hypothetical protein
MHDPLVVAFEIRRPRPRIEKTPTRTRIRWPAFVTVWHREPGGHDSGTVCRWSGSWRWHVHHWRVQVHPLQQLRRWALTRCEWCGGRSRKGDKVNFSSSWDGVRSRWWRGERDLRHHDCDTVWRASRRCLCDSPMLDHGSYGTCTACGKSRAFGASVDDADRLLAALPPRSRIPVDLRSRLEAIWDARCAARGDNPKATIKPWR